MLFSATIFLRLGQCITCNLGLTLSHQETTDVLPNRNSATLKVWIDFCPVESELEFCLKFIYSEKATKFCEMSTNYLSYILPVILLVEISQNSVAFSEYVNLITKLCLESGLFDDF